MCIFLFFSIISLFCVFVNEIEQMFYCFPSSVFRRACANAFWQQFFQKEVCVGQCAKKSTCRFKAQVLFLQKVFGAEKKPTTRSAFCVCSTI